MTNDLQSIYWKEGVKQLFTDEERPASFLSSWSEHVLSWTQQDWDLPFLLIKFEDLVYKKKEIIKIIINFFIKNYGFEFHNIDEKIENILLTTNFEKLQKEEIDKGFSEAPKGKKFFKSGEKNQWIKRLNNKQISDLENKFKTVMDKFNYI